MMASLDHLTRLWARLLVRHKYGRPFGAYPRSGRGLGTALLTCVVLVSAVVVCGGARPAAASSPAQLASEVAVLAKSPAGQALDGRVVSAITDPAVARFTSELLAKYGSALTGFQRDLLQVNTLITGPNDRALLSALHAGSRLTPRQLQHFKGILAALAKNPAVQLLIQKGRQLKEQPSTLSSDISTATNSLTGSYSRPLATGDAAFDAAISGFANTLTSSSVASLASQMQLLLSKPGATSFVQALPPLAVASFISTDALMSLRLPGDHDPPLSPAEKLVLAVGLVAAKEKLTEFVVESGWAAAKHAFPALVDAEISALLWGGVALAVVPGAAVATVIVLGTSAFVGGIILVRDVAKVIQKLNQIHSPTTTTVTVTTTTTTVPATSTTIPALGHHKTTTTVPTTTTTVPACAHLKPTGAPQSADVTIDGFQSGSPYGAHVMIVFCANPAYYACTSAFCRYLLYSISGTLYGRSTAGQTAGQPCSFPVTPSLVQDFLHVPSELYFAGPRGGLLDVELDGISNAGFTCVTSFYAYAVAPTWVPGSRSTVWKLARNEGNADITWNY